MLAIFWVYGLENFCDDIEFMLKRKVTMFWRLSWAIVTPGIMIIIFVYYMVNLEAPSYSGWAFPTGYLVFGWILFAVGLLQVPLWISWFMIRKRDLSIIDGFKEGTTPTINWGPKNSKDHKSWMAYKVEVKKRRAEEVTSNSLTYWQQKIRMLKGN
jgi:solute carrier family 6 (neurotransmitter transporter, glycine) member 5/9